MREKEKGYFTDSKVVIILSFSAETMSFYCFTPQLSSPVVADYSSVLENMADWVVTC